MNDIKCKCGYSTWTRRLPDRGTVEFGVPGWYWGDQFENAISDIDLADGADRYCYSCGCQLLPGGAVRDWREEASRLSRALDAACDELAKHGSCDNGRCEECSQEVCSIQPAAWRAHFEEKVKEATPDAVS